MSRRNKKCTPNESSGLRRLNTCSGENTCTVCALVWYSRVISLCMQTVLPSRVGGDPVCFQLSDQKPDAICSAFIRCQLLEQQGRRLNGSTVSALWTWAYCVCVHTQESHKSSPTLTIAVSSLPDGSKSCFCISSLWQQSFTAVHFATGISSPCPDGGSVGHLLDIYLSDLLVWVHLQKLQDCLTVNRYILVHISVLIYLYVFNSLVRSRNCEEDHSWSVVFCPWPILGFSLHLEVAQPTVSISHCGTMQHSTVIMKSC